MDPRRLLPIALLLAACGQSGALYLPEEPEAAPPAAGAPDAKPAEEEKEAPQAR